MRRLVFAAFGFGVVAAGAWWLWHPRPLARSKLALVAVYTPSVQALEPDSNAAAALWLATAGIADRQRLLATMARVDAHVDRAKNPLVEDLDDLSLREDAVAAYRELGPAWTVVAALARLGSKAGACNETLCVHVANSCPPAGDCTPLGPELDGKRARLLLWPLAGGARLACEHTEDAAAALRAHGVEKGSTIGWAFASVHSTGNEVRGGAATLLASLASLPDTQPPGWLVALANEGTAPDLPWLEALGPGFVIPKLSRWADHERFLTEVREVVAPLGCSVTSLRTASPPPG